MTVRILPEAESELFATVAWYEDHEEGVGLRFLAAYEKVLDTLQQRADSSAHWETESSDRDIRRLRLRRFPYLVIYELIAESILVLAVAHTSRRPDYWIDRRVS